ncbi:two pore calcium channel protein 1B isoform X2 [Primulina huaijiensis]|uniref:two pore calcium channel protein 1B isoform X2 n=1 Tax=Primulina huaijiensis TaxID=1492673 RepID=UPI003CC6EA22
MKEALLGGGDTEAGFGVGGSGSGSGGGGRGGRKNNYKRRSDAIAYGSAYQKAAALVDLAEDGVGIPEEIFDQPRFGDSLKSYLIFIQFDFLWSLNYFALIVLCFFEKPLWCSGQCNDRDYYFLGQLPYLNGVESLVYEGITLLILTVHIFYPITYEGFAIFWKNNANKLKVLLLILLIADIVVFVIYLSPVAFYTLPFRIAPYIRVAFFALNIRDIKDSIILLAGMLGTYLNVLALFLLFLLFSSWLAFVIFEDTKQGKTIFTSYGTTLYQMFVLFTTSNNPDVWIPAYKTLPKISRDDFELIFYELDDSRDVKITLEEFHDLSHAIGLSFQKEDIEPIFESCTTYYHSPASEMLKNFVRSAMFGYIIAFVLIMNFVAVVIETTLDIENNSAQGFWQKLEFVFGWLYVLEMALKVYSYGFMNYWRDGQNRFDFVITWVIVIGETTTFISPRGLTFLSNGEWIRYLLLARMLRLIRLLMHVPQYRAFVATFLTLIPSLMPYLGTLFCVLCIYCSLGVQIFGGLVNVGNPDLDGTDLQDDDYLLFNFNDYPNGMVTLFNLVVMGNWQVWMQSYKTLTGTVWTLLYFVSFYLITVLLLLNLVVAFVLEAFFAEMDLESSEKCENGEAQDDKGNLRRRNIGIKSRNQRVDNLLHHMLSAELQAECSTS